MSSSVKPYGVSTGVGIALGLIATGIQWKYPQKTVLADWLFVIAGLIVFGTIVAVIVRQLTIKQYERQHAGISNNPAPPITQTATLHSEFAPQNQNVVHVNVPVNQPRTSQVSERKRDFAEPHIEFTNVRMGLCFIDSFNHLQLVDTAPNAEVMLARFYYKPERNVPPSLYVKALISIADKNGNPLKPRYDGVWLGCYKAATVNFGTAETRSLVVALLPPPQINDRESIVTWGFGARSDGLGILSGFVPDREVLIGNEFRFTIELVGKTQKGEVLLHTSMELRINVREQTVEWS